MIGTGHCKDFGYLLQVKWRSRMVLNIRVMISDPIGCFYFARLRTECRAREFFILSSLEVFVIWWGNRQTSCHTRLSQVIAAP